MWDGPQARAGAKRRTTLASGEGVEFYVPLADRHKRHIRFGDNTLTERRRRNLSDRYLFLISIGIGTKPVKVNFWTRLFSGFSGVTSVVYRLPFESTCLSPNAWGSSIRYCQLGQLTDSG